MHDILSLVELFVKKLDYEMKNCFQFLYNTIVLTLLMLILPGCSDDDPVRPGTQDDVVTVAIEPSSIEAPLFSELTFQATLSTIPQNVRYEWSVGETVFSELQNFAKHIFLQTGTFQIGYAVINASDNTIVASATASVVITSNPDAEIEFANIPELSIAMGKYEITQAQWSAVMGNNPSFYDGVKRPVEKVRIEDIQEFIRRLNVSSEGVLYRLPTEEEWEAACRAGTTTDFFSGNLTQNPEAFCTDEMALNDVAWYCQNSESVTHDVGLKDSNEFGLFDTHGNVWELCSDIDVETERNVIKGGSALDKAFQCQAGFRGNRVFNGDFSQYVGFRLVREDE